MFPTCSERLLRAFLGLVMAFHPQISKTKGGNMAKKPIVILPFNHLFNELLRDRIKTHK